MSTSVVLYLSLDEVLAIHFDQIERYGGSHGVRDLNLLLSALFRPQTSFGGADLYKDLFKKAAALLHSLILNHPFVDGNKRTGMVSAARILFVNGYILQVSKKLFVQTAVKISRKELDIEEIAVWLKRYSKKI